MKERSAALYMTKSKKTIKRIKMVTTAVGKAADYRGPWRRCSEHRKGFGSWSRKKHRGFHVVYFVGRHLVGFQKVRAGSGRKEPLGKQMDE